MLKRVKTISSFGIKLNGSGARTVFALRFSYSVSASWGLASRREQQHWGPSTRQHCRWRQPRCPLLLLLAATVPPTLTPSTPTVAAWRENACGECETRSDLEQERLRKGKDMIKITLSYCSVSSASRPSLTCAADEQRKT